jgi:hypothetical protein
MILTFLHLAIFHIPLFSIGIRVSPPSHITNPYCEAHYVAQKLNSSKNMFPVLYTTIHIVLYRKMSLQESVEMLAPPLRMCSSLPDIFITAFVFDTLLSTLGKKPCHCHKNILRQGVLIL